MLLSAVIITFNEEKNIERCIRSLAGVADEVIVLDSFSADRTVDLAIAAGAKVTQQPFAGYIRQKNDAMALAAHDLILSLDADEAPDATLAAAIQQVKLNGEADAWHISRCTMYCGKFIRHGSWYPDRKIRLFNRKMVRWEGEGLHEKVAFAPGSVKVAALPGDLLHYSFYTIEEHVKKCDLYSTLGAAALYERGKKSSWVKLIVNPSWTFIQGYILRGGFLDGFSGFSIAVNSAQATFLKYAKLYQLWLTGHRP